jgi:anti-sigma regulatory factor (Ser/Thr protein kinase)
MTIDSSNNQNGSNVSQTGTLEKGINIAGTKKEKVIEICITMPTQAYFLSGIRDFTLNLIKNMTDFSEQWAYRFQSIVDELCNNAIEHGSREGEIIKIIFQNSPKEYIQIMVDDTGTGPHHQSAKEVSQIVEERRKQTGPNNLIRGRGLPKIVSEWTDELEFSDNEQGGIRVRVKKFLNDPKFQTKLENPTHIMLN